MCDGRSGLLSIFPYVIFVGFHAVVLVSDKSTGIKTKTMFCFHSHKANALFDTVHSVRVIWLCLSIKIGVEGMKIFL